MFALVSSCLCSFTLCSRLISPSARPLCTHIHTLPLRRHGIAFDLFRSPRPVTTFSVLYLSPAFWSNGRWPLTYTLHYRVSFYCLDDRLLWPSTCIVFYHLVFLRDLDCLVGVGSCTSVLADGHLSYRALSRLPYPPIFLCTSRFSKLFPIFILKLKLGKM